MGSLCWVCFNIGDQLINGLQLTYQDNEVCFLRKSNKLSSFEGNPKETTFHLEQNNSQQRIQQINCHCGALVDWIELVIGQIDQSGNSSTVTAGGDGGERYEVTCFFLLFFCTDFRFYFSVSLFLCYLDPFNGFSRAFWFLWRNWRPSA
jgi:hypothetical protein